MNYRMLTDSQAQRIKDLEDAARGAIEVDTLRDVADALDKLSTALHRYEIDVPDLDLLPSAKVNP